MPPTQISVVLPVYRNAASLWELHQRLRAILEAQGLSFELIFVNDASPDDSLSILRELAYLDPAVVVLDLEENLGQHRAILQGLLVAQGGQIVLMDADLQDPPEAIPALLLKIKEGYPLVFAGRRGKYEANSRLLTSRLYKTLLHLLTGIPADAGIFLVMKKEVAHQLLLYDESIPSTVALLGCVGYLTASVPVVRMPRADGRSAYTSWRRLQIGLKATLWVLCWKMGCKKPAKEPKISSRVREVIGQSSPIG